MKNLSKISVLMCLSIFLLSGVFVSCDKDDDNNSSTIVKVEDVPGNYTANVISLQGKNKNAAVVPVSATANAVQISDFPVKEIVSAVISDKKQADTAITKMGAVKYDLAFAGTLTKSKTSVELSFSPKTLELELPVGSAKKKVVVTIAAKQKGAYAVVRKIKMMQFEIDATAISVDGKALSNFETVKYGFTLSRK